MVRPVCLVPLAHLEPPVPLAHLEPPVPPVLSAQLVYKEPQVQGPLVPVEPRVQLEAQAVPQGPLVCPGPQESRAVPEPPVQLVPLALETHLLPQTPAQP